MLDVEISPPSGGDGPSDSPANVAEESIPPKVAGEPWGSVAILKWGTLHIYARYIINV
jgi:hypothetical protein